MLFNTMDICREEKGFFQGNEKKTFISVSYSRIFYQLIMSVLNWTCIELRIVVDMSTFLNASIVTTEIICYRTTEITAFNENWDHYTL